MDEIQFPPEVAKWGPVEYVIHTTVYIRKTFENDVYNRL